MTPSRSRRPSSNKSAITSQPSSGGQEGSESSKGRVGASNGGGSQSSGHPSDAPQLSFLMKCRGWVDALVIAYVLAMFIRTYAVELFKIPTGSMTPTLVGDDRAVDFDYNGDGEKDLILFVRSNILHVFIRKDGKFVDQLWVQDVPYALLQQLGQQARPRHDMILVNKFSYWFQGPRRGDILVFKVPNRPELNRNSDINLRNPWNPKTPIFIKRCVGLPGDSIHVEPPEMELIESNDPRHIGVINGREIHIRSGPAMVNGSPVQSPVIFQRIQHFPFGFVPWYGSPAAQEFKVQENQVFMMGDNSSNSTDSRAWGGVPFENIKGKAIFRYFPFRKLSFLE